MTEFQESISISAQRLCVSLASVIFIMSTVIIEDVRTKRHPFLTGVLGPQRNVIGSQEVSVICGAIPSILVGLYVRNGPNPVGDPVTGRHHWFEGDGMLHVTPEASKIGVAVYGNRYVETYRSS